MDILIHSPFLKVAAILEKEDLNVVNDKIARTVYQINISRNSNVSPQTTLNSGGIKLKQIEMAPMFWLILYYKAIS